MTVASRPVVNFNPGPAILPLPVLEQVQAELLDFDGTGMSILEHSHRGPAYGRVHDEAIAHLREILDIPPDYQVLFLQGGASLQFCMLPLNLLPADASADYIDTGVWSRKAFEEAERVGRARIAASGREAGYARLPRPDELDLDPDARYLHVTSNNTISGTQWPAYPGSEREHVSASGIPLICDMSSDLLSRRIEVSRFGMIYACAQKNLGPAGLTVVIIRDDLIEAGRQDIPKFLQYRTHAKANSLYHTPNTFGVYVLWRHLQHIRDNGGLATLEDTNRRKQALLYRAIDESAGFYRGTAEPASRSWMNVTMRLASDELEARFLEEVASFGLVGLKGHRSVGGIRASLYNAMPLEGVERLVRFMEGFAREHRAK